jgi:hypothetical protein
VRDNQLVVWLQSLYIERLVHKGGVLGFFDIIIILIRSLHWMGRRGKENKWNKDLEI